MTRALDLTMSLGLVAGLGMMFREALTIAPPANYFPAVVVGLSLCLSLAAAVRSGTAWVRHRSEAASSEPAAGMRDLLVVSILLFVYVAAITVSYVTATVLFLFALYTYVRRDFGLRALAFNAAIALVVSGAVYVCFVLWLGVYLPF